ncbi:hypothetical protein ACP4OV_018080 [Aristida adscensionis]
MEIPSAVIHRLQSSIREAAGAAPDAAPGLPLPSVADFVAAFDSGASAPASPGHRCGRCSAAGGLLRGVQSAVCAYCGCPWRGEGSGGGIAFRDGAAYRSLLGSLGLDGSELVEFDSETTSSNKSKEAPKNGMIISDLLDLKLTCIPENKGTAASSITKEQVSSEDTVNMSDASLNSFFLEKKEEATATAGVLQIHAVVQEKQITDNKSSLSSRSEVHSTSTGLLSSQRINQIEATSTSAHWDADFKSATSAMDSLSFPAAGTASNAGAGTVNKTNMKSTILEHPENLPSASVTLAVDYFPNQKAVQFMSEGHPGIAPEPEFIGSSLDKNYVKSDQLNGNDDNGVNDDKAFDDWQEFAEGGNQGILSNDVEDIEEPLKGDSSEIKTVDSWPVGNKELPNIVNGDSDDWQAFSSSSGQGDSMKSVVELTSGLQGSLMRPAGETTSSISLEHSLEANSVDLWPVGNVNKHNSAEIFKEEKDSFDDWQDFTSSGKVQSSSFNQTGVLTEFPKVSNREIKIDPWFRGDNEESRNADQVNGNDVLNDWQDFTGSVQVQQTSSSIGEEVMNVPFDQLEGTGLVQSLVNGSNKNATNTASTNIGGGEFDFWQDFAKSGHQQESTSNLGKEVTSVSPQPAKEIDSLDLWLSSNLKESSSSGSVRRNDDISGGRQDFGSFGQAHGSTTISGEGHILKGSSGSGTSDLWALSHANEKNLEQITENDDLFDDWQDFRNSCPQTSLQTFSDALVPDRPKASSPDALAGLEFGCNLQLTSSQNQKDKIVNSNEAEEVLSDEHLKCSNSNGMQQMGDVDSLRPTNSHGNNAISRPGPDNVDVEKLLSQMHDLSFMLKDELSVPDKPVDH